MSFFRLQTQLTFILGFGTNVSAIRFRKTGSIFRQCRADMLIAISDSSLASNEFMNGSAPRNDNVNKFHIEGIEALAI